MGYGSLSGFGIFDFNELGLRLGRGGGFGSGVSLVGAGLVALLRYSVFVYFPLVFADLVAHCYFSCGGLLPVLLLETQIGASCRVRLGYAWGRGGGFHKISDKFKGNNAKDHEDAEDLHEVGFVVVEEDAESNSEDLPCGDNERYKMLFELFDHPIDEHLSDQC